MSFLTSVSRGAAAVLIGVNPIYGLLVFTSVGGLGIAALGRRASARDVQIGTVLAFMLGLGRVVPEPLYWLCNRGVLYFVWRNIRRQF